MSIVVCNSTPLICLAAIGQFELLHSLFGRIDIPQAVFDEVVSQGAGRFGAAETAAALWIERHDVFDRAQVAALQKSLHVGESEVIVLAGQINADLVLMDDLAARRELKSRGIVPMGTAGVLMLAKVRGLISELKPELEKLGSAGFRLSQTVINSCLTAVGE